MRDGEQGEQGDLVTGPLDQMLKQLIKGSAVKRSPKNPVVTPGAGPSRKKAKTESAARPSKPPLRKKQWINKRMLKK